MGFNQPSYYQPAACFLNVCTTGRSLLRNVLEHVLRAFFFLRKNKLLFDNNPKNLNVYDFPIMKCDLKLEKNSS